jgi:hypothetical protein
MARENNALNYAEEYDERDGCGCAYEDNFTSCGCKSGKKHIKKEKCRAYSFVSKNPFDVGIAKQLEGNEYLVLLSGNHHSVSDYDHNKLPDFVGIGERPCRNYKTLTADELVNIWHIDKKYCDDPCFTKKSFKICHPNGFLNYYLTNGTNRSQVVEISEATIDTSQSDPALVLKVKILNKSDERLDLDGLYPRMFRVSLVIDHYGKIHNHTKNHSNSNRNTTVVQAPPSNYTFAPDYADYSKMMGPTTTTTANTTQSNQQTTQQQLAQQQQMGDGKKDDKKGKKKNAKKKNCKKIKDKKKRKECIKKKKENEKKKKENNGEERNTNDQKKKS